jgi:hypothetical protein
MVRQQRRYQWPWMWVLCLGVLGMTLVGCGDSSPTSDTTGTPTVVEQLSYDLTTDGDITVGQGQTGTATITATRVAGVSQAVTWVASGLPTGATATFVPTACTPTCTSTLTIATAPLPRQARSRSRSPARLWLG